MDIVKMIAKNLSMPESEVAEAMKELIESGLLQPVKGSSSSYKVADILYHPEVASRVCHLLPALEPYATRKKARP